MLTLAESLSPAKQNEIRKAARKIRKNRQKTALEDLRAARDARLAAEPEYVGLTELVAMLHREDGLR